MEIFERPRPGDDAAWRGSDETVDLREVLAKFWARKRLIVAAIVLGAGLAFGAAKLITPVYTSSAYVVIKTLPPVRPGAEANVVAGLPGGPEAVQTQVYILQSRALASATIERLHLDRDPEFNPLLRRPGALRALAEPVLAAFDAVSSRLQQLIGMPQHGDSAPAAGSGIEAAAEAGNSAADDPKPSTIVVNEFLARLSVAAQERSNVILVSFSSARPRIAALVSNTLVSLYLEQQVEDKAVALTQEVAWLDKTLPELRQKMRSAELALAEYRQKSGLVGDKSPGVVGQELSNIRAQLTIAQGRKAEAAARLSQIQALLSPAGQGAPAGVIKSAATASESPILQRLQQEQVELEAQISALKGSLGPNHPKTLQLMAQLREVRDGIRREGAGFVGRLKAELAAAEATEASLAKQAAAFTHEFTQVNGGDIQLANLVGAADADRKVYERYLQRANEVRGDIGHVQPDATLVSSAAPPLKPSYPNTTGMVMIGLALGTGAGLTLAALMDALLGGLRNKQQVEDLLGVRCLGLVPKLKRSRRNRSPTDVLQSASPGASPGQPLNAAFGEAIRSIELKLLSFERDSGSSQVVLVTAALPAEGKTWVAGSLAASLAAEGLRVVIVDCDLRRPALHRMFHGERGPGLTDYFAGNLALDEIVHNDRGSGLDYIPVGSALSKMAWRITAERLRPVIDWLRARYSFIILDSAPVLAVSETAVLSQIAQRTILVVRWGSTAPQIARHAVQQLLESGGAETAVLLSMVDLKRAARYGDMVASAYQRLESSY